MDAQRLLKTSALLPVIALLIAAPGWAQTLQAPPSVTIGNTGFNTAPVTSSDAGTTNTAISFTTLGPPTRRYPSRSLPALRGTPLVREIGWSSRPAEPLRPRPTCLSA